MGITDRITEAPRRTADVTFAIDPNDVDRLDDARHQAKVIGERLDAMVIAAVVDPAAAAQVPVLQEQHATAVEAVKQLEAEVPTYTLTCAQLQPVDIEKLRYAHRPSKEQKDRARVINGEAVKLPEYNEDTYPPALLAAACTHVAYSDSDDTADGLSVDEATVLFGRWSQADQQRTIAACELLALAPTLVGDLGKG